MLAEWIKGAGDTPIDRSSFQRAVEAKAGALQTQADHLIENFVRIYAGDPEPVGRIFRIGQIAPVAQWIE